MRKLTTMMAAVLALTACKSVDVEKDPKPDRDPEPRPVKHDPPPPKERGWQVTLADIGWEVVPPAPPDRAFRANSKGLQAHNKGDWAGSMPYFREAVEIVTEYDLARYNL